MKKAFTLIELLVAISIIAILTAFAMPNFMGARERARDAQAIQDLQAIKTALRLYYNDNQAYPTGPDLSTDLDSYMDIAGIGYTYAQQDSGDGFLLTVALESGKGDEDIISQAKCGIGATVDKTYAVCGK